jgi:hypothetical protein
MYLIKGAGCPLWTTKGESPIHFVGLDLILSNVIGSK